MEYKKIFGKKWEVLHTDVPEHVQKELLLHRINDLYSLSAFKLTEYFGNVGGKAYQIALVCTAGGKPKLLKEPIWDRVIEKVKEEDEEEVVEEVIVKEYVARIYENDQGGFEKMYRRCMEVIENHELSIA